MGRERVGYESVRISVECQDEMRRIEAGLMHYRLDWKLEALEWPGLGKGKPKRSLEAEWP
jgi:hypothetical protein